MAVYSLSVVAQVSFNATGSRKRLPSPFARATVDTPVALTPTGKKDAFGFPGARVVGVNGHAKAFSVGDISRVPSFREAMGGAEEVTNPIEESWIVNACVKAKSAAVASVRICVFDSDKPDAKEIPETDPVVRLFRKPNRVTSEAMMLNAGSYARLEHGEDWWFLMDGTGNPINPGELPAQILQVRPPAIDIKEFDSLGFPSIYTYTAYGKAGSRKVEFPAHAVIAFTDYDPYNLWRGLGAVDAVIREIGVAYQVQRYVEAVAHEGGDPGGFVILPPEASKSEVLNAQAEIDEEFGNPANRGRWKTIAGADFRANTITPKDMEFQNFMQLYLKAVSAVTGVPLPVVGILDDATYSNYEAALRAMWQGPNGVLSYLRSVEDRVNVFLFQSLKDPRLAAMRMRFDTSHVAELQRDVTPRVETAARVASYGVGATFNEALALVGVDEKVKGGDVDVSSGGVEDPPSDTQIPAGDGSGTPAAPGAEGSITGTDVQTQLLNGAQMQVALDIVSMVVAGEIPRDSGIQLLQTLLGLTFEQAEAIMGSAENPDPEDAPAAKPDANAEGDPIDAEGKSMRVMGAFTSVNERREYVDNIVARVIVPGERELVPVGRSYLRAYIRAQLARFRDFASLGKAARGFDSQERISAADQHVLDILLLNRKEWNDKMRKAFAKPIAKVTARGLESIATEFESVSIGVNDPRVVQHMAEQLFQLTEGVNSTLAKKVKVALLETFKDSASIGDLQLAVQEKLPELEGNLARAFRDREARALAIARTEASHATNGARQIQMRAEGVTKSEWSTAGDDAVRPDHAELDGEVRDLDSDFLPGLAYPGDPRAAAELVINCRCILHPLD